jgi:hypothetical protein
MPTHGELTDDAFELQQEYQRLVRDGTEIGTPLSPEPA